ncbi:MAG: demethoxyubiquinone hydroxylase family protein [Bacillota bacterium]
MDREELLLKLNWFYSLELSQVDLYSALSNRFQNKYTSLVFERIAAIEQQHVDNMAAQIKKLGGKPSILSDIVAPITGSAVGEILSLGSKEQILQIAILLEEKAMHDYQQLILSLPPVEEKKELVRILQSNLVDEDLHTSWFRNNKDINHR